MHLLTTYNKTARYALLIAVLCYVPLIVAAQDPNFGNVKGFISNIITFISNVLIPLIFALALLLFLWGMFIYFIVGGGDEGQREKGKGLMVWAIIALVVMSTIWAIVNLFAQGLFQGLGTNKTKLDSLPGVQTNAVSTFGQPYL
jgi:hypothetical protein